MPQALFDFFVRNTFFELETHLLNTNTFLSQGGDAAGAFLLFQKQCFCYKFIFWGRNTFLSQGGDAAGAVFFVEKHFFA